MVKSTDLLPIIAGSLIQWLLAYPSCLKAIAAAAKFVEASEDLTLGNDIYLQAPGTVQRHLNSELTQHFSAGRLTSYEIHQLSPPNLRPDNYNIVINGLSFYPCLKKVGSITMK